MSLNLSIAIDEDEALSLVRDGKTVVGSKAPLGVAMLNGQTAAMGYTRTLTENGRKVGLVDAVLPDGTRLSISDSWSPYDASTWQCDRTICILEAGKTEGLRFTLEVETSFANTEGVEDFEFYAAGSLYKKNDTDHDGKEDYLGTFDQDFRRRPSREHDRYGVRAQGKDLRGPVARRGARPRRRDQQRPVAGAQFHA